MISYDDSLRKECKMEKYSAKEARRLSDNFLNGEWLESKINIIFENIKEAAKKGHYELVDPLKGLNLSTSFEQREAIKKKLKELGYKIEQRGGGDPRERSYEVLVWK